jgi:hypothetical protein
MSDKTHVNKEHKDNREHKVNKDVNKEEKKEKKRERTVNPLAMRPNDVRVTIVPVDEDVELIKSKLGF